MLAERLKMPTLWVAARGADVQLAGSAGREASRCDGRQIDRQASLWSRPRMAEHVETVEAIRARFRPQRITTLFVGESAPHSGISSIAATRQ
jgi:hypothetical protein